MGNVFMPMLLILGPALSRGQRLEEPLREFVVRGWRDLGK
ncbi:hypothetical protein LINPERPRIM_LOCUS6839 [Linum perenne]